MIKLIPLHEIEISEKSYLLLHRECQKHFINSESTIIDYAIKEHLSNDFVLFMKNRGLKCLKIDVTDLICSEIQHDCIVEGENQIHISSEYFEFDMNFIVEIGEKESIGEEITKYMIENITYINSHLYNTNDFEDVEFSYNVGKIVNCIKA